jgi:predicted aldo/keto reductase-like oxidoreductase
MSSFSRRDFLKTTAGAAALATAGAGTILAAEKRLVTDLVPLGNSGVKVTRLALGTGTYAGRVQREIGQEEFNRVVRHAYDRGIRFFETADGYKEMQVRLATALKGLPRDSYKLMTKMRWRSPEEPKAAMDRLRRELNTDYFDILLIHCVRFPNWAKDLEKLRDELSEAKQKKILLAHGASCHGLLPLRDFPGNKWLDVALLRINHDGARMDTIATESNEKGDVNVVVDQISKIHAQGTGVIGMKLIGEGKFTTPEQRDASIRFVYKLGTVDTATIGFKSTGEVDEAIERINTHLNS